MIEDNRRLKTSKMSEPIWWCAILGGQVKPGAESLILRPGVGGRPAPGLVSANTIAQDTAVRAIGERGGAKCALLGCQEHNTQWFSDQELPSIEIIDH